MWVHTCLLDAYRYTLTCIYRKTRRNMRFHTRTAVILIFTTTKIQNLMTLLCTLQSWKVNFAPVTRTRWVIGTMASTVLGSRQKSGSVAAQTLSSIAARRGSRWSQRKPPGKSCCLQNHEYRANDMHVWCVILYVDVLCGGGAIADPCGEACT
jgi:hypothetical protein